MTYPSGRVTRSEEGLGLCELLTDQLEATHVREHRLIRDDQFVVRKLLLHDLSEELRTAPSEDDVVDVDAGVAHLVGQDRHELASLLLGELAVLRHVVLSAE